MEISLIFSVEEIWLAIGTGLLAAWALWLLYKRWYRWKHGRKFRAFERQARKKWEGHRLK